MFRRIRAFVAALVLIVGFAYLANSRPRNVVRTCIDPNCPKFGFLQHRGQRYSLHNLVAGSRQMASEDRFVKQFRSGTETADSRKLQERDGHKSLLQGPAQELNNVIWAGGGPDTDD